MLVVEKVISKVFKREHSLVLQIFSIVLIFVSLIIPIMNVTSIFNPSNTSNLMKRLRVLNIMSACLSGYFVILLFLNQISKGYNFPIIVDNDSGIDSFDEKNDNNVDLDIEQPHSPLLQKDVHVHWSKDLITQTVIVPRIESCDDEKLIECQERLNTKYETQYNAYTNYEYEHDYDCINFNCVCSCEYSKQCRCDMTTTKYNSANIRSSQPSSCRTIGVQNFCDNNSNLNLKLRTSACSSFIDCDIAIANYGCDCDCDCDSNTYTFSTVSRSGIDNDTDTNISMNSNSDLDDQPIWF